MTEAFKNIKNIFLRECGMILKDSRLRSVVLVAPFLYAALMCGIYINHSVYDLPVAVINQDNSSLSRTLIRMLDSSPKLEVKNQVTTLEEVKDLMLRGDISGAVVIPREFSRRLRKGRDISIPSYVNAATLIQANAIGSSFNKVIQTFSAGVEMKALMKKGASSKQAREIFMPVKMDLRAMFNPTFNYTDFMIPGILITILQQVILLGMALTWTGEKEAGTLAKLLGMGTSSTQLFLGKMLPYLIINFLIAEVFLRVVFPLNNIPMQGSWALTIGFTLLFTATVVTWGFWVSAFLKTRLFATQVLMFMAMPSFVLSGFTWPLEAMPQFFQSLSAMLPMTHFISSFRNIYLADASFQYVRADFLILCGFLVANILLSYFAIARLKKSQLKHA